jgi:hypothetical protein
LLSIELGCRIGNFLKKWIEHDFYDLESNSVHTFDTKATAILTLSAFPFFFFLSLQQLREECSKFIDEICKADNSLGNTLRTFIQNRVRTETPKKKMHTQKFIFGSTFDTNNRLRKGC